jgi:ABC-type multidrug transport system ATPase subunit
VAGGIILSDNLLSIKNVSKEFNGNRVLKDVSLNIKKGEIHALIGENGAGKSTLMNILFGMSVIHSTGGYSGSIEIEDEEVFFASPHILFRVVVCKLNEDVLSRTASKHPHYKFIFCCPVAT